jgi:hypothetical protein
MGTVGWRLIGTAVAIAAGAIATKVVGVGWRAVSGHEAPTDPSAVDETSWREALLYGAVLGLTVGAARVVAERKAAQYYLKSTGRMSNADAVND